MLDNSQLVKIESNDGRTVVCQVFYKGHDLAKDPQYVGKAERPAKLFGEEPVNNRIGYRPWRKEVEIERQRQEAARKAAYAARRSRDDDYDDYE